MKTSRLTLTTTALALLLALSPLSPVDSVHAQSKVSVQIDGKVASYDQPPVIVNDRVLVPVRGIFESLGARVEWATDTQTVIATKGNATIELPLHEDLIRINGREEYQGQPPVLLNNRVLVPVRFVSDLLGAAVTWDAENQVVRINSDGARLFTAIDSQDLPQLERLLQAGVNPDTTAYSYDTALVYAMNTKNWPAARVLLSYDADRDRTYLRLSAARGSIDTVLFYLEHKVTVEDNYLSPGQLALDTAASYNHTALVRALLQFGVTPNIKIPFTDEYSPDPLIYAIANKNLEMVADLLAAGSDVKSKLTREDKPYSLLFMPALHNNGSILRQLLEHGADPDLSDDQGWTALMMAAELGNTDAVRALLEADANPHLRNNAGATAWMIANAHGNQATSKLLAAAGATGNEQQVEASAVTREYVKKMNTSTDWSPLKRAVLFGDTDQVESLLAAGDDPNQLFDTEDYDYLMMYHDQASNLETLKALVSGPKPLSEESRAFLLYVAVKHDNLELAQFLLNTGLKPDPELLTMAAEGNHLEMVELLEFGADPNLSK